MLRILKPGYVELLRCFSGGGGGGGGGGDGGSSSSTPTMTNQDRINEIYASSPDPWGTHGAELNDLVADRGGTYSGGGGDSQGTSSAPGVYQGPNIDFSPGYTIDTNGRVVSSAGNVIADAGRQALPQNYEGGYVSMVDRFDGGGPGASGNTFGGFLGGVSNTLGFTPLGYGAAAAAPSGMVQGDGDSSSVLAPVVTQSMLDQEAYNRFVGNGGTLSFEEWLAAGKPEFPVADQTPEGPSSVVTDYVAPVYNPSDILVNPTYTTQGGDALSGIASLVRNNVYNS